MWPLQIKRLPSPLGIEDQALLNRGILSLHTVCSCEFVIKKSSTSNAGKIKRDEGCRRGSASLKLEMGTGDWKVGPARKI